MRLGAGQTGRRSGYIKSFLICCPYGAAEQVAEKVGSLCPAPKGASDFEGRAVSLKRYPDTELEFFRSL